MGEALESHASLEAELRQVLSSEFGRIPSKAPDAKTVTGSSDECTWHPVGVTVPDDGGETLRDDVGEAILGVLEDHGVMGLDEIDDSGVEPYLAGTADDGLEVEIHRFGDVHVTATIQVDPEGRECDQQLVG